MPDEPRIEIRAASSAPAVTEGAERPRLAGHFARFGTFNEIDSVVEGRFLERIEPGAFARTFKNNGDRIRMLFQHGRDPEVGEKPIGSPDVLREDKIGPYFEGDLFDSVPPLIVDGLRAGEYGISYRFSVINEDWNHPTTRSDINPQMLPERTIREAKVYEFGPVTFPADPGADYAVRALTLSDLDAALAPPEQTPALPDGPEAEPHSEEGTREEPIPVATPPKENIVPVSDYHTLDEMGARVRELDEEIKRAAELPGILPDKEQDAFDAKVAERAELDHAMTAWRNRLAQVREAAKDPRAVETPYTAPNVIARKSESDIYDLEAIERSARSTEDRSQKLRDNALRAAEQLRTPSERYDQDASRERLAHLLDYKDSEDKELARLVLSTNSPQYRAAFNRYVKSGGEERGTALAVGVDGTGGYAVPVSFDPTVVAIGAWTAINPYRAACRVETIVGTDTWQALTATAITAAYATEAAAADEQGPTFARPEYIAKRAHAFVTVSYEMAGDRPDLSSELGTLFGEAKDTLEENQFTVGVGTTVYPQGMGLKDAYTRVDSVTNDTVAVADIRAVEAALPIRHRMNAAWFLSRAAIRAIQAFETTGGQLFSGVGYPAVGNPANRSTGNTGLTLLGYPIWETPSMPWTPTTDDTTYGVFCDPRTYVVLDRVGMSIRVIPDMLNGATPSFPTGQIGIYAFWRNTARVLNVDGGRQGAVQ